MGTAVITGASGDIGKALCSVFKDAGYYVIGSDVRESDAFCDKFIELDLQRLSNDAAYRETSLKMLKELIKDTGLTVLVNNAAVQMLNKTADITHAEFRQTLDVNFIAPFLLAQGLLQELQKAKGSIINMASIHAEQTKPKFVSYAASKAGLVGLTKAMAIDLAPDVRVNAISPAAIRTQMLEEGFNGDHRSFNALKEFHPVKRIGEPEEVAKAALYLASVEAAFITGSVLSIDGGIGSRLHDPS